METQTNAAGSKKAAKVVDLNRYAIDVKNGNGIRRIDPIDVARESQEADAVREQGRQQQVRTGDHLLMVAAKCVDAEEFDGVIRETLRRLNWGRGREIPTPRTFSVYVAAIKRGMAKFGLRPLDTVEIPLIREGAPVFEEGRVVMERVKLDGIGVFKRAMSNFTTAERHAKERDRRADIRKDAEKLKKAGFITAEAELAVRRVLWTLRHTRDDSVMADIAEDLLNVAEKYPSPEPFPERNSTPH